MYGHKAVLSSSGKNLNIIRIEKFKFLQELPRFTLRNGRVTAAGLKVAMAEKMTAGEYEANLYSLL